MSYQIIDSSFSDDELLNIKVFLDKILIKIKVAKGENKNEYIGEKEIREKIEKLISLVTE